MLFVEVSTIRPSKWAGEGVKTERGKFMEGENLSPILFRE